MLRLTRWTMAHRRLVITVWVAAAVGILALSSSVGTRKANNFSLPNSFADSDTILLAAHFPDPTAGRVVRHDGGTLFRFVE